MPIRPIAMMFTMIRPSMAGPPPPTGGNFLIAGYWHFLM
jgi:hypothetical protein